MYLVRHHESVASATNTLATFPLTCEDGGLIPRTPLVLVHPCDYIASSPKRRCIETCVGIANRWPDEIDLDLDERNCGVYNGKTFETKETYINAVKEIELYDHVGGDKGSMESCEDILVRFTRVLNCIMNKAAS